MAAFMAPALAPLTASIFSSGASRRRSSTPHVNAPREPPPWRASEIGWAYEEGIRHPIRCFGSVRTDDHICVPGNSQNHGVFTPSAWLTSHRLGGDGHLDRSEIRDGYGGKSRRVGAGQQAGRDRRHDRPNTAAAWPISRRSGSSGRYHPSVCSRNGAGDDPGKEDPPI